MNFIDLYPMSFLEFLDALDQSDYRRLVEDVEKPEPFPLPFHEDLIDLLKQYFFVGGMPEAVYHYAGKRDVDGVRAIQKEIIGSYELDFAKHAPRRTNYQHPPVCAVLSATARGDSVHGLMIRADGQPDRLPCVRGSDSNGRDIDVDVLVTGDNTIDKQ